MGSSVDLLRRYAHGVRTLCAHGESEMGSEHESGVLRKTERPTVEYEGWEFYELRLEPSLLAYLRDLGGGDVSEGVRNTVRFHQEQGKQQK